MSANQQVKVEERIIAAQPSWVIASDQVELAVTRAGGHMAPVTFEKAGGRPVQPYYISPWQGEGLPMPVPVLEPLRGDFFCLPFGGNGTPLDGERHPPHGETSGSAWTLAGGERRDGVTTLVTTLDTTVRRGRVTRRLSLVDGQNAVYSNIRIEGFAGPAPLGHHAILAMPAREGAVLISTSPFKLGMTCPHPFSRPENGEYQALAVGATFEDLGRVPTIFKDPATADCSVYPARLGYADLIGLFEDPAPSPWRPSWAAAVNTEEGWLWFVLKDPATLPARLFWMENHGRHGSPWNGRNCCLGIEDGCLYFDAGLAESARDNIINRQGIPTCHQIREGAPLEINTIQGAVRVPEGFGRVSAVEFGDEAATFIDGAGKRVKVAVRAGFLREGKV